jgi:hypothetical protein
MFVNPLGESERGREMGIYFLSSVATPFKISGSELAATLLVYWYVFAKVLRVNEWNVEKCH